MAQSADFHDEISKGLECSICMTLLDNPKVLTCHHWFCKTCIDELLEFNTDGSAVITCPMKCKDLTFIGSDQTTNDLPIPYQLTSLLDVFVNRDERLENERKGIHCNGASDCENNVSLYCNICSVMLCYHCSRTHNEKQHNSIKVFLPIQFERKNEKVMVVCKEHSTFAKYVCCKSKFICLYCKHRRHRVHKNTTIQQEADQVREFVCSHEVKFENMENIIANTAKTLEATNASIDRSRDVLKISLKNRKIKCMSEYLAHLNNEESKLLAKYNVMAQDHIQRYPEAISNDYFTNIIKKHDIQIISEKEKITRNIFSFTSDELVIPATCIVLSESSFLHKNSLGKLKSEMDADLTVCNEKATSSIQSNFTSSDYSEIALGVLEEFQKLVEEVLAGNEIYGTLCPQSLPSQQNIGSSNQGKLSEELPENFEGIGNKLTLRKTTHPSEEDNNDNSEDLELEQTFDLLNDQLSESVDQHFDTLLKAIQDQFMTSAGLHDEDDSVDSDEEDEEVDEETEDFGGGEHDESEEGREDIEQICNQS